MKLTETTDMHKGEVCAELIAFVCVCVMVDWRDAVLHIISLRLAVVS